MSTLSAMSGYSRSIGAVNPGDWMWAVRFTPNGEHLVSGGDAGVRVWRVKDGEQVAKMQVGVVECVAVSKDGRFIAAGSRWGDIWVWSAATYEQVFASKVYQRDSAGRITHVPTIHDVDFSPGSDSRLVSSDGTATIWDFATRKKVHKINHGDWVQAAKYSPKGDRIATAANGSVRVWDSGDGQLLVNVRVQADPWRGLLWFNNNFFVKTKGSKISQIDASTGLTVSEWLVPDDSTSASSCIALPQHGKFIAYSTRNNITFWDTLTHTQVGLISRDSLTSPIAFSPDDQLAVVVQESRINIEDLSLIKEPGLYVENAALNTWKHGQLSDAESLLTAASLTSKDTAHHVLASRALVRARLQKWDAALEDAEESIKIQSSAIGYIAKCMALVGKGDVHAGYRACDIAFLRFHLNHAATLLLIKAVVRFMSGEHEDAISRMDDLITVRSSDPTFYVVQAHMHVSFGNLHMESGDYARAIQSFEDARVKLGNCTRLPPLIVSLISGWKFDGLAITIEQRLCEALSAAGHAKEASESVLCMVDRHISMPEPIKIWVFRFMQRRLSSSENNDNVGSATADHNNVSDHMKRLFREWVKLKLTAGTWKDTVTVATGFAFPTFTIYQVICEHLESTGNVVDGVACFHQMCAELKICGKEVNWTEEFKARCRKRLEGLGDVAMNAKQYYEAISRYTTALSLDPATTPGLLVKRSMACVAEGEWDDAISDANKVIKLDPHSPLGYVRKFTALHGMGCYDDATRAFEDMLSKMSESSDPEIRRQSHHYVRPEKTREAIRTTIEDVIHASPPVLINTLSGRLCNKSEQASAFEMTPTFTQLVSSVTTHIDHARIKREVGEYFRYAMFSHRWEGNEPLFDKVINIVVYDPEASSAHEKLQMFCRAVREAGLNWAWSDTCCINKGDHLVLQEALVSMFKWYECSAMTIIFLRGVERLALRGALTRSMWNMRAWTLQEYHASKVVRIYTEDWTPYLGLEIYNHKESPEIISEMEEATGVSAKALMALRPGLDDIREKLRLASTRQTTRIEDAAYSLLGIFALSLPITYGEGDNALGRLLAQLLTSSGDVSILAWTGKSGSFNSCLPSKIAVFCHPPTSHIPSDAEMRMVTARIRSLNFTLVTNLYDQLSGLSVPSFTERRMKFPCLAFKLGQVSVSGDGSGRVFCAQTNGLGVVVIKTHEDLSQLSSLYLVHPWIDFLLDRQPIGSVPEITTEEDMDNEASGPDKLRFSNPSSIASTTRQTRTARLVSRIGRSLSGRSALDDATSLRPPSTLSPTEKRTLVLQFVARLRKPFGALLLTPTRRNMDEFRRVAADSLIRVQLEELIPEILDKLIRNVRVLDVL